MAGRRRKDDGGGHAGEEAWLLPYADMITLLLGLFIVMFALSSVDAKKFDAISQAFSQTFRGSLLESPGGVTPGASGVLGASATSAKTQSAITIAERAAQARTRATFDAEREQLEQMAQELSGVLKGKVDVREDDRGLVLTVAGDALFASGSAELLPGAATQLRAIAKQLGRFGAPLDIEGHTDGQPFRGPAGNQQLSSDRAISVWKLFRGEGVAERRMRTTGMGAAHPRVDPPYPEADMPQNRRVEIHVLAPASSMSTFTPRAKRARVDTPIGTGPSRRAPTPVERLIEERAARSAATSTDNAASGTWGGTSTPAPGTIDVIAPIVEAS